MCRYLTEQELGTPDPLTDWVPGHSEFLLYQMLYLPDELRGTDCVHESVPTRHRVHRSGDGEAELNTRVCHPIASTGKDDSPS